MTALNLIPLKSNKRSIGEISTVGSCINTCSQNNFPSPIIKLEIKTTSASSTIDSPQEKLRSLGNRSMIPSLSNLQFFHQYTSEESDSYDVEVTRAVRCLDLESLKILFYNGRTFQCSNRFGESLLHMACRRGSFDIVKFFLDCGVSINCVDDMGRTPLHDALWNSAAKVDLVDLIVKESHDLLFMSDARGHTPFEYCRREHWSIWNNYLESRKEMICRPSRINSLSDESQC